MFEIVFENNFLINGSFGYFNIIDIIIIKFVIVMDIGVIVLLLLFFGDYFLKFEIILDIVLLLVFIFFLNREFEISYRLFYYGDK